MTISSSTFKSRGGPLPSSEIVPPRDLPLDVLPNSHRTFIAAVGPGHWANGSGEVMPPGALYAFDADCWEMEGFVGLVDNASGVGDFIAVNPTDPVDAGERPVYYCGHDPFSVVRAADSFEDWIRQSAASDAKPSRRYQYLDEARSESYRRYTLAQSSRSKQAVVGKRWWQFWR
jgi:hypothetical protein